MSEQTQLSERLLRMASMIESGERICWGSDTALMREAAHKIDKMQKQIDEHGIKVPQLLANLEHSNIIDALTHADKMLTALKVIYTWSNYGNSAIDHQEVQRLVARAIKHNPNTTN